MSEIMDRGTASAEFFAWFDSLNLNPIKRKNLEAEIERSIDMLCFGIARIDEGRFTLLLEKPLNDGTEELSFKKCRISVGDLEKHMKGKNEVERSKNMISKMFTKAINPSMLDSIDDDWFNIQSVAAFFLPR